MFADTSALAVFILNEKVNFPYGLVMLGAMALGSYLGTSYSLKKGDLWVRRLFILVVSLSAIKLLI